MTYELINELGRGVLVDRTPIFRDIKDTFEVSFLPRGDSYVALFKGADGVERRTVITDGKCRVPNELFGKEQYVDLVVCQTDGEQIVQSWQCEPIRITAMIYLRKDQWQLSGGMTEDDCYKRLIDLEHTYASTLEQYKETLNTLAAYRRENGVYENYNAEAHGELENANTALKTDVESVRAQNTKLAEAVNEVITAVNSLTERLTLLEKNYDPTIID